MRDLLAAGASTVQLPTETEWVRLVGGDAEQRYPWDNPKSGVTTDLAEIKRRANIDEAELNKTSPVGMYPQGRSWPHELHDLAGNVWEWTNSWYDKKETSWVLCGGSWHYSLRYAHVSIRDAYSSPHHRSNHVGFRLVAPVSVS